jgi:hypothetical protein
MSIHGDVCKLEKRARKNGMGMCPTCRGSPPSAVAFGLQVGDPLPDVPQCPRCGADGTVLAFALPPGAPELAALVAGRGRQT